MSRSTKTIISIVLCVWIFAMGLELGSYRERKAINATLSNNNKTNYSTPTTAPRPTPTQSTTTNNQPSNPQNGDSSNTDPTGGQSEGSFKLPQTNAEIAEAFNKAMNNTKHTTRSCDATKHTDVQIQVTDCSVPRLTGTVNNIVQRFIGPEDKTYSFVEGADGDTTIFGDLPPSGRDTSLDENGIATAYSEPYGEKGYRLLITLIPESNTLDNEPYYHANTVGYLNLASLDLDVNITEANFSYSGATVSIYVNDDGLIDQYDCTLPLSGTGSAKVVVTASATLEGASIESWTFSWH